MIGPGRPRGPAAIIGALCASLIPFAASVATLESTRLGIGGDEFSYFALAAGKIDAARAPYRYRVLGPLLARLLPWSIPENVRVLNLLLMGLTGTALALFLTHCGVGGIERATGLLAFYALEPARYALAHPYGVDALTYLIALGLFWAATTRAAVWFGGLAVLGVATKEVLMLFLPAYVLSGTPLRTPARWRAWRSLPETRRAVIACSASVLVFLGLRLTLSGGGLDLNPYLGFGSSANQPTIFAFIAVNGWYTYLAIWWGTFSWLWIVLGVGLLSRDPPPRHLRRFSVVAVAGTMGAAALVTYPSRLAFVIFPVVILLLGRGLGRHRGRSPLFRSLLLALVTVSLVMIGLRNYSPFAAAMVRLPSLSIPVGCWLGWLGWQHRQQPAANPLPAGPTAGDV